MTAGALFTETVLLARYLGAARLGTFVLVIAYAEAIQQILDFRTREAMTRYLSGFLARSEEERAVAVTKLLWLADFVVVVTAFLIVNVTAPIVAPHLTDDPDAVMLIRIYAIAMLLSGLVATAGAVLRVFDRFRMAFLAGVSSILCRLAIIVGLVVSGSGLEGLVLGRVAGEIIAAVIIGSLAFMLLKHALWPHRHAPLRALKGQRREILHFLVHMNLQGMIRAAATKLDVLSVGVIAGPSAASIYKIGVQFGSSPLLFADPLFISVYPMFSRWHAMGVPESIRSVGRKSSIVLALLAIPTAALLAIESESILSHVVGEDFADAWLPMVIILVGVLPAVIFFWARAAMLALGDARKATTMLIVGTGAQFALLLALTPLYGATGAAIGFATLYLVAALMYLSYLRRRDLI